MTKAQRVKYALAAPVFVLATVVTQFSNVGLVSAAAVTWDGSAGDGKFSTAANWSNDTVPTNGDNLIFSANGIGNTNLEVENDLSNFVASGISVSGTSTGYGSFVISGNALTLSGNVTNTAANNGYPVRVSLDLPVALGANVTVQGAVSFEDTLNVGPRTLNLNAPGNSCGLSTGTLSGAGSVIVNGANQYASYVLPATGSSSFSGSLNINSGLVYIAVPATVANISSISTTGSGSLAFVGASDKTFVAPVSLGGSGSITAVQSGGGCSGGGAQQTFTTTLSGPVTLTSDFKYSGDNNLTITGTYTTNGHTLSVENGSQGSLTTPQGSVAPQPFTTQLDGDQPNSFYNVRNLETAVLNGARGSVTVNIGGVLKGTGTAETVYSDGTVNPGNSPGKLTVLDNYNQNGTQVVEIQNKDAYDQVVVGAESSSASTLSFGAESKLDVQLYGTYDIKAGDKFTIFDNVSTNSVSGTFNGLVEGTQFTVNGVVFSISYVGGTGNDVVLTAINSVAAPNTGVLQAVKSNPAIVAILGLVSAAAVLGLALRRKSNR